MRALPRLGRASLAAPALVPATAPAQAAPAPLVGVGSGRCLDVTGGSSVNGALVQLWDCTGGANQKFRPNPDGSITATQSGLCLDAGNQATANGTAINLLNCNGQTNQQWRTGTGNPTPTCTVTPVNPNASPQARKLLCYLYSQYGNHILSGQQESTWIGGPDHEINHIRTNTGKYPAIRALDFGDSKDLAPRAIAWWNAGGIPMIGYHMGAPTKPDTYEGTQMSVSINAVLTPGTAEHRSFLDRLDQVLFGTWHGEHLTVSNSTSHLHKVYNHSYVITRDELPNLK